LVKVSLKSTFSFNDFLLEIRHMSVRGISTETPTYLIKEPTSHCIIDIHNSVKAYQNFKTTVGPFLNSVQNHNSHFQSTDLEKGPGMSRFKRNCIKA
jgi:hypothetical protein